MREMVGRAGYELKLVDGSYRKSQSRHVRYNERMIFMTKDMKRLVLY